MGIANLEKIVNGLMENGKSKSSQASIVENACRPNQRVIVGTLENIVSLSKENKIKSPATIIVGDVVQFQNKFSWYDKMPLSGKSVLITRDKKRANILYNRLISLGAQCHSLPMIDIEYNNKQINDLNKYKAILLCSSNGANAFIENIDDLRILSNIKIGVVGKADFYPSRFLVNELIKESVNHTNENDDILIITSNISPINADEISSKYNRNFTKLELYDTKKIRYKEKIMIENINIANYITFFSPSTVESFLESINYDVSLIKNKKIVSIGPVTSKKIRDNNLSVYLEAEEFYTEGVIKSLLEDK